MGHREEVDDGTIVLQIKEMVFSKDHCAELLLNENITHHPHLTMKMRKCLALPSPMPCRYYAVINYLLNQTAPYLSLYLHSSTLFFTIKESKRSFIRHISLHSLPLCSSPNLPCFLLTLHIASLSLPCTSWAHSLF